jgi:SagB-type dehydrogenase family enzyme
VARMSKQFGFLWSPLVDPRRIELREPEILTSYQERGGLLDVIDIGHDQTKLRRIDGAKAVDALTLFQQPFMQPVQHSHDRRYPLTPTVPLPKPVIPDRSFGEVIRARRSARDFGGDALGLPDLSALLFGAIGETGHLAVTDGDPPVTASLRTIPSAGALHPTGLFAAILKEGAVARGVYHYDVPGHALELVRTLGTAECQTLLRSFPIHPAVVNLTNAAALFFISSIFWRARAKYGPRGYRYCLQEAGAACQSLNLTAVALGLAHVVLGGFYDDEVHALLEIDGIDQAVITSVAVGAPCPERREEHGHVRF